MRANLMLSTDKVRQRGGYRGIAFTSGVLVDQCGPRAGVPHPRHELAGASPSSRCKGVAGLP